MAGQPLWMWGLFLGIVIALLVVDLGLFNRKDHAIGLRESLMLSVFYITVAVAFGGFVWVDLGAEQGIDYFTAFVVEKSLSLDNLFVISLIFSSFAIPAERQHRVLVWGIIGVIVLRGIMIGLGATLISQFHWVLWIFGAFLVITGIRMALSRDEAKDPADNALIRFMRKRVRVTDGFHGHRFLVRLPDPQTGRKVLWATPLLMALMAVEFADVIFAVDSVPAVFAITTDAYVVYTSNIFAILGLRALYFALAAVVRRFAYLHYALAAVLIFIGGKIFWADLVGHVPAGVSLGVTFALLTAGIVASIPAMRREDRKTAEQEG